MDYTLCNTLYVYAVIFKWKRFMNCKPIGEMSPTVRLLIRFENNENLPGPVRYYPPRFLKFKLHGGLIEYEEKEDLIVFDSLPTQLHCRKGELHAPFGKFHY